MSQRAAAKEEKGGASRQKAATSGGSRERIKRDERPATRNSTRPTSVADERRLAVFTTTAAMPRMTTVKDDYDRQGAGAPSKGRGTRARTREFEANSLLNAKRRASKRDIRRHDCEYS